MTDPTRGRSLERSVGCDMVEGVPYGRANAVGLDRAEGIVRCLRCQNALFRSPPARACAKCGAPLCVDDLAVDVIPDERPPRSWGARAMQSRWLARVYERWWRPVAFGLSTGFGAPRPAEEARLVLERLVGSNGPWLDLSCGPGSFTRQLVAHSEGRSVFGTDRSRAMLELAHAAAPDAALVRADAATLPFADGAFGAVVNLAALDLYADPARVVAESARILACGGRWVCSTFVARVPPDGRPPRSMTREWLTGVRKPTIDWLAAAAEHAGLQRFGNARFRRYVVAWADKA